MPELFGRLILHIASASGLADCDTWGKSDPYCIVKLDDEEIGRTDVSNDNNAPVWDKDFFINLKGEGEQIFFEVWDSDAMRMDDLLGLFTVPVSDIQSTKDGNNEIIEGELKTVEGENAGNIRYSMKFREFGGKLNSELNGNKKALHVGINYLNLPKGHGQLSGCFNDVSSLNELVISDYNFSRENTKILRDDDDDNLPTRENIVKGIEWLIEGASSGDSLLFQFSGHGGQVTDKDGDEDDAKDETIIPCDFRDNGQITDDELFKMLVEPLPSGVMLTTIMDCCHSGTGMDLAFVHKITDEKKHKHEYNGFILKKKKKNLKKEEEKKEEKKKISSKAKHSKKNYDDSSDANVLMLSGCMDHQTSADATIQGKASGAMTFAFKQSLKENSGKCSYKELVADMYKVLNDGGYTQVPQLSTARPFDLESQFTL